MTQSDNTTTETLTIRARLADEIERIEQIRPYLLVFEEDASYAFQLPSDGSVVIGRSSQIDLRLRDNSASRRHAELTIRGGVVTVADLGSHNGTRVNGELVRAPRALQSGDVIAICNATLVLKRGVPASSRRPILDAKRFLQRFEEEIERALRYSPELQLLCIELGEGGAAATPDVAAALSGKLRLIDVAGSIDQHEIMVLLPEISGDEAVRLGEDLLSAIRSIAPSARAGHAACPADGCDVETLLSGARSAAGAAPASGLLRAPEVTATRELAGRRIVVADPAMVRCYALVERLAESDLPVLIHGETGAGKEIIAQAIHALSPRRAGRMVTLNCAAIQDTLLESELFGYEKGAFSGAATSKAGLLESADGGTMFLDEVAELSPAAQAKLLRVLETKKLTRLGDLRERSVDIRLVAATHRDLTAAIQEKRFREDLYFRLGAAKITLPPLRDRRREVGLLARSFLAESSARLGRRAPDLSAPAMQAIYLYRWPGNVRELRNAMEFVAATVREPVVHLSHLPDAIREATASKLEEALAPPEVAAKGEAPGEVTTRAEAPKEVDSKEVAPKEAAPKEAEKAEAPLPAPPGAGPKAGASRTFRPLEDEIRELERARMAEALEVAGGVRVRAAQLLSMPLRTFATKLKLYGLGAPAAAAAPDAPPPRAP